MSHETWIDINDPFGQVHRSNIIEHYCNLKVFLLEYDK